MALARMNSSLATLNRTDVAAATVAVALGASIAYIDSRPYWDDTGVTAFSLLVFAAFLGFLVPRRVWLWAVGIGIWVPLLAFVRLPGIASAAMLLVLGLTFAGAYGGRYLRIYMDGQ
jgi:hypothetical protein